MIDKEKIAYAKGMAQAYFDISMNEQNEIPILETNYKINKSDFQKGYWQGQLEYATMLSSLYLNKSKEIDEGIKKFIKE